MRDLGQDDSGWIRIGLSRGGCGVEERWEWVWVKGRDALVEGS